MVLGSWKWGLGLHAELRAEVGLDWVYLSCHAVVAADIRFTASIELKNNMLNLCPFVSVSDVD